MTRRTETEPSNILALDLISLPTPSTTHVVMNTLSVAAVIVRGATSVEARSGAARLPNLAYAHSRPPVLALAKIIVMQL